MKDESDRVLIHPSSFILHPSKEGLTIMRHLRAGKKLGRNPSHRKALYRNLTMALIANERIVTTVAKAKAVRPFVEKLITLARRGDLHARRLATSRLGAASDAEVKPSDDEEKADHRTIIQKLFDELGPRFRDRPGGYTRIIKRHQRRLGDGGPTAFLELLKEGETKVRARQAAPAPAPEVEEEQQEEEEEQPAEQTPQSEPSAEQPQTGTPEAARGEGAAQTPPGEQPKT
jgi:large subunit ribosomal protein L17